MKTHAPVKRHTAAISPANSAQSRQSRPDSGRGLRVRPDSGLGFRVNALKKFEGVGSSLGNGKAAGEGP